MSKRLMVVDDSKVLHTQISKMLADTDFEIVEFCRDGESAVAEYGDYMPDLITIDIIMPGIDGLETSKAILEKYPDAKIIILSSLAYDDTLEAAEKIGAKGFISKPIHKEEVLEALNRALGDEAASDED